MSCSDPNTFKASPSSSPQTRSATLTRDTNETKIALSINLDGGALEQLEGMSNGDDGDKNHAAQKSNSQIIDINTGIGFLDHMIHAMAKHSGWSLWVRTKGDLHIDDHHTAEDTFIAIGQVRRSPDISHTTRKGRSKN